MRLLAKWEERHVNKGIFLLVNVLASMHAGAAWCISRLTSTFLHGYKYTPGCCREQAEVVLNTPAHKRRDQTICVAEEKCLLHIGLGSTANHV